jgi:hypothetical protein
MNLGVDITKEEIDDLVHLADLDGDGTIDKSGKTNIKIISNVTLVFLFRVMRLNVIPPLTSHDLACFLKFGNKWISAIAHFVRK